MIFKKVPNSDDVYLKKNIIVTFKFFVIQFSPTSFFPKYVRLYNEMKLIDSQHDYFWLLSHLIAKKK